MIHQRSSKNTCLNTRPRKRCMEVKQQERRIKEQLSLSKHRRKAQAGGTRLVGSSGACTHRGVSFISGAPQHPTCKCLMRSGHLLNKRPLNETKEQQFSCSYDKEEPARYLGREAKGFKQYHLVKKKWNQTPPPKKGQQKLWRNKRRSKPVITSFLLVHSTQCFNSRYCL